MPGPDSEGIPPDVVLTLTFNDFPDPDAINLSTMLLFTGFYYHTGNYWVDLVERRALFRPSGLLSLGLGYTMVLKPGIRSLRGCQLADPPAASDGRPVDVYTFPFRIVEPDVVRRPTPLPPSFPFAQVLDIFAGHCAGSSCHINTTGAPDDPDACLIGAASGLSLCGRDAHNALVGVPSRQVTRLVRVAPHDSSRSYLLRKLINAPPVVGHAGVPGDTLSRDDLHVIQGWIDDGAKPAPRD